MLLLATVSLLLAACAPAAPAKDLSDPLILVIGYYTAIEASDIEKAMTYVSDDYVMTDPTGFTVGKEAATTAWKGYIDAGFTFDQSDFKVDGNRVTSCYKVYEKGNLIDEGCGAVTHVRDSKIIFDGLEPAEQVWIVQKYYEALNAQNPDLALAFVAPDALFINPMGKYEGTDAIRKLLNDLRSSKTTLELSNFRNTAGEVVYDYIVLQGTSILDRGTNGLTVVKDGKIVFDGTQQNRPGIAVTASDPATIAHSFYQAINEGDIDAAMQLVAEDVKCRGACYLSGKQSFQSYIQGSINMGGRVELSDLQVNGESVTYIWTAYNTEGVQVALGEETLQIQSGKIILLETQLGVKP
jgi:ketosteroid isomerase-like protein